MEFSFSQNKAGEQFLGLCLKGGKGKDILIGDLQSSRILTENLVVNGSFEADTVVDHGGNWEVFSGSITGWQTDIGPGIEIQVGSTGGMGASDGNIG